jgi:hypothetical protein
MTNLLIAWGFSVFATYRTARMVALEDGPGNVFMDIRGALLGTPSWVQKGMGCPLCLGFWIALVPAAIMVWWLSLPWWSFVGLWLAMSGAQTALVVALRDFEDRPDAD